jgi:hypothetical protein
MLTQGDQLCRLASLELPNSDQEAKEYVWTCGHQADTRSTRRQEREKHFRRGTPLRTDGRESPGKCFQKLKQLKIWNLAKF